MGVLTFNQVHQWKLELRKHVVDGPEGLKVLYMDNPQAELPHLDALRSYDIILFSKPRFEKEIRDGSDRYVRHRLVWLYWAVDARIVFKTDGKLGS